jgi:hypothetical protein
VGPGYVVAWDLGGRLYSVFKAGHTFRRGLGGRLLHKWRDPEAAEGSVSPYDERQRVVVGKEEGDALIDECAALAARMARALADDPDGWRDESGRPPGAAVAAIYAACAAFDSAAAEEDARRFARVYSPVGILPPDQYLSVVLQATTGCSFGECTFCDLYHDAYQVKTVEAFTRHIAEVREYLGPSLALRGQAVFLGSANALAVPMPRLEALLDVVRASFGPRVPVHGFVDGFTGALKDAAAYRRLKERGLGRVYVGLESGHDPLLAFVRKPGTSAQALETVRALKDAGVAVGLIVMIGLGGDRYARGHVADTIAVVNRMGLSSGDILYFSDLVEYPNTAYPALAADADVRPLPLAARIAQLHAIRAGLSFGATAPKCARYDVREFIY